MPKRRQLHICPSEVDHEFLTRYAGQENVASRVSWNRRFDNPARRDPAVFPVVRECRFWQGTRRPGKLPWLQTALVGRPPIERPAEDFDRGDANGLVRH